MENDSDRYQGRATGSGHGDGGGHGTKDRSWLQVRGKPSPELAALLETRALQRQQQHGFTSNDVKYIAALDLRAVKGELAISDRRLELLRNVCATWHVDLKDQRISSHRPFVGPVIVFGKKVLFRIDRVLLNEFLKEQRRYNAAVITLLAELCMSDGSRDNSLSRREGENLAASHTSSPEGV